MANIKDKLNKIKTAVFGHEVRDSIHDGIDAINKETESTTQRQKELEGTFDSLIINAGNSNAEIVAGRVKEDGTKFDTIGKRLNETDSQIKDIENSVNEVVNIINNNHPKHFFVETLNMSNNLIKCLINENHNLIPVFTPIWTSMPKTIIWLSNDTSIATVNQLGVVNTRKLGECTITAIHVLSGLSCSCDIQVLDKLSIGDPVKTPINISRWEEVGTDWIGQNDATKDFLVTSVYTPIKDSIIELECPQGMIWTYIYFYEGTTPLTNQQDGTIAGKDATTPNKKVSFSVPINATHFRITVCDITYRLIEAHRLAGLLKINGIFLNNEGFVNYDKFKSNNVILNTRHIILSPDKMTQKLEATETPIGATNGLVFTSTDVNVATVDNSGLIKATRPGSCDIIIKNKIGGSQKCSVIVESPINTGSFFNAIEGANNTDKLKNAIEKYSEVTGINQSYLISSTEIRSSINPIVTIRNSTFIGSENKTRLTINGLSNTIIFNNCVFDNVGLFFANFTGTMKFINCTFKNWKYSPIHISANGAKLEFTNTIFKDANPNKQEWIENIDWVRFHAYNPIEVTASNVVIKVNKCTFNNIMSRCVVHWQNGYTGGVIDFTDNTVHATEGHCVNMESSCSGDVSHNHFYFVGALRGSFGKESLAGESQGNGVGGNAIFSHGEFASYCDITANYNKISYAMENGIEGGFKEIAYNYIEYTGYRYRDGYNNPSMEGIWGSAKNGIRNNIIINTQMDGIRIQNYGLAGIDPCVIEKNITIFNDDVAQKSLVNSAGISIVSLPETGNKNVTVDNNTIIGFSKATKIDGSGEINFSIQNDSEYAY